MMGVVFENPPVVDYNLQDKVPKEDLEKELIGILMKTLYGDINNAIRGAKIKASKVSLDPIEVLELLESICEAIPTREKFLQE